MRIHETEPIPIDPVDARRIHRYDVGANQLIPFQLLIANNLRHHDPEVPQSGMSLASSIVSMIY